MPLQLVALGCAREPIGPQTPRLRTLRSIALQVPGRPLARGADRAGRRLRAFRRSLVSGTHSLVHCVSFLFFRCVVGHSTTITILPDRLFAECGFRHFEPRKFLRACSKINLLTRFRGITSHFSEGRVRPSVAFVASASRPR